MDRKSHQLLWFIGNCLLLGVKLHDSTCAERAVNYIFYNLGVASTIV